MCRKTITSWTTKKYVQLALEDQKQEEVSLRGGQPEDVPLAEQRQRGVPRKLNKTGGGPSKQQHYELCRFESLNAFIICLESLNAAKYKLSLIEILLILRSNISIFLCTPYTKEFFQISTATNIILVLHHILMTISYVSEEASCFRLTMSSVRRADIDGPYLFFWDIMFILHRIAEAAGVAFPSVREEILDRVSVIFMMLQELHHFFGCKGRFTFSWLES